MNRFPEYETRTESRDDDNGEGEDEEWKRPSS